MEKALLFSEVWSDFSVEVETGVEVIHWVAFVAGDGEAPSLVGVEAEAAVDNGGVAPFGKKGGVATGAALGKEEDVAAEAAVSSEYDRWSSSWISWISCGQGRRGSSWISCG